MQVWDQMMQSIILYVIVVWNNANEVNVTHLTLTLTKANSNAFQILNAFEL